VYSGKDGTATVDPEPTFTTAPRPRSTILGSTAAVTSVSAHRFTRIIRTKLSTSASWKYTAPGFATAALFTSSPTCSPWIASRSRRIASSPTMDD
jgi:hypothetical protein